MSATAHAATVAQGFGATARAYADKPAVRAHQGGVEWSWDDYRQRVRSCAAGLVELGGRRGDTLACWLTNRPEFHAVDTAAVHVGMAPFSVYPTYTAEQAARVIGDAGARILVAETAFLERARTARLRQPASPRSVHRRRSGPGRPDHRSQVSTCSSRRRARCWSGARS